MMRRVGKSLLGRFFLILVLIAMELGFMPVQETFAATLIVTNTNDSGPGSLRQAVADAGTGDVITFDPSLAGQTITLVSDIVVTFDGVTEKKFTIDGSGLSPQVTISGANKAHMEFSSDTDVTISSLTITHGYPGGIISSGNLTIINSTLKSNISHQSGGAIRNSGTLILKNSTITQNRADTGGGIAIEGNQNSQIINSTIIGNLATNGGGISIVGNAFVNTYNTTFAGNFADHGAEVMAPMASSYLGATNTVFVCAQENTDCYQYAGNIGLTNSILGVDTLYAYGLMALVDNGGPTQTMALLPGSPLIDAGNDASCTAIDQRGVIRPMGSHCDIGAYEYYETQAIVRYVKPGALGLNNGTSWANAYTDLQTALSATFPDEEIWVAAGTYKPTTTTDRSVSFNLHNGVALYGGFAGGETSLAQRDPAAHPTILSGDIGTPNDNSDNSYHVMVGSGTNNSAILDGFIVRGGNANEPFSNYQGGGMYIYLGEPLIANTTFEANSAYYGGGVFIGGDSLSPEIMSHPILKNLIFKNNSADYGGGGLSTENYIHAVLTEVVFDGNTAGFSGGGSRDNLGHISFSNVVFKNNTADWGGGTLNQESKISMTNVTFSGNLAGWGGGMKNNAVDSTLINVSFYGNSAEEGGGIWNTESKPVLTNVTFYNNSASTFGGAIFSEVDYGQTDSQTTVRNAILWGNTALTGPQIYNGDGSVATVSDSVVEGGFPGGTNIITTDPKLGTLGNYGGFTETIPLQVGSSALDVGNDAQCPGTDQRGVTRPQGSHCDIGAYEDEAIVRFVKQDASGMNNGTSWADAYTDLQSALAAASPGDEIWVAAGTYKPTMGSDRTSSYVLKSDIATYGGFAGTETSLAQRDPVAHPTILSGDIGTPNDNSDNSYHVVVGSNTNNTAVLDGFTVTGGNANGLSPNDKGGGMYNYHGSPTIVNMTFANNFATFGGGMYNGGDSGTAASGSSPVLVNVVFNGNSASEGGGMENQFYSSPTLNNVSFSGNTAVRSGGGILNYEQSSPSLTDVTFTGNTASGGGGMSNWGGSHPTLERVTFIGNSAENGGGMGNDASSPSLHNVIFDSNTVSIYGGAMSNDNQSSPTLTNVTFTGNQAYNASAETYGGGMTNQQGSAPTLTNVTFYGNSATHGGGMLNRDPDSAPILTNVTFNSNTAAVKGGAIANDGNMIVRNGIFWGNNGGEIFTLGRGIPNVTYSVVQGGYTGTGNLSLDPLLGPLANNGGFTKTMAIGATSPAIDAGDNAHCPSPDQRGVTRPQGNHCDIGAYEYQDLTPPTVLSIVRADPNPTSAGAVRFTVSFSENVINVDSSDFSLATTGVTGATIANVTGSGASYTVTVNTGSGNGTIRLVLVDDDSIKDPANLPLGGIGNGNGNYNTGEIFTVRKNPTFSDVPTSHLYYKDIEILYANGLTSGCSSSPLKFCPDQTMNRGEAAVFILRGNFGPGFVPGPVTHVFRDDWAKGSWAEPWAEAMFTKGLSSGCKTSPLKYCPWDKIPREQAVIFALRLKYGNSYAPPPATGTLFADLTDTSYYATAWMEQAYKDGLITNCGISAGKPKICPANVVSRGLAAQMIVRAKNLSMP